VNRRALGEDFYPEGIGVRVLSVGSLLALFLAVCGNGLASEMVSYSSPREFQKFTFSHAKWDKRAEGITFDSKAPAREGESAALGVIESPEVAAPFPFDQLVPSWNAYTKSGGSLTIFVKARVDGNWSKWYKMMLYDTDGKPEAKRSYDELSDALGDISEDTLKLEKKADAFKLRIELASTDGKNYPSLRFLAVNLLDTAKWSEDMPPVKKAWGVELDVPEISQLSDPKGWNWCSATSTTMVLGYWAKKLNRPEMAMKLGDVAEGCLDRGFNGYGNWSFNVAFAGEFKGMRAYVSRFTSVSQIEQWIARGVPVIVAVDYGRLCRWNTKANIGHLMVIRGFTGDGDPIFNDPGANLAKNEVIRKVFKRADFEYGWLHPEGSYGTVYIIYPERLKL